MRSADLDAAISIVHRMLALPGVGQVHQLALRKALRELVVLRRGGKLDTRRVNRTVKIVCEILADEFLRK